MISVHLFVNNGHTIVHCISVHDNKQYQYETLC